MSQTKSRTTSAVDQQLERALGAYEYDYPKSAVALKPAHPRDAAKLLVFNRRSKKIAVDTFANLGNHLPAGALLVLNQTKVLPARLECIKPSGGRVRLLFVERLTTQSWLVLADRGVPVGDELRCGPARITILARQPDGYSVRVTKNLAAVLRQRGEMPLPPYLRHSPLTEAQRRREYQSIFAREEGSSAAPTASLHFTARLMQKLRRQGIQVASVTLHVGLGTFAPLTSAQLALGKLHQEHFSIDRAAAAQINRALAEHRPVIAVGTTALRALESAALSRRSKVRVMTGQTRLFIRPGYKFRVVNGLITNFHVPRSSLLMLVASLIGRERVLQLYRYAIRRGFRLFSFGDAMLIV